MLYKQRIALQKKVVCVMLLGCFQLLSFAQTSNSSKLEEIDSNFRTAKLDNRDVVFYNALKKPFVLEGFPWTHPQKTFYRLPTEIASPDYFKSGKNILFLANHTAGGAIRFRTNSPYIVLRAELTCSLDMNHMPRSGSSGFDLYEGEKIPNHVKNVVPKPGQKVLEIMMATGMSRTMRSWTLYLPLYGGATKIEIGLAPDSKIEAPLPHAISKPILFYGSSITQGGFASRPGNAYTSMLCRAVDAPQINLGFSGSCRGEAAIAEAIAKLDLAVFVMDYDHNAHSLEELSQTHEPFFQIIRKKHPELPIIIISRCNFQGGQGDIARREIIKKTYDDAIKSGDKHVWFIDGETLFGKEDRDACTVDGCHPNDLGFYRMYKNILPVLRTALESLQNIQGHRNICQ